LKENIKKIAFSGLFSILILCISYAAVGRLGLLLAIPPGYATAIFPSAGIAVAALLIWGKRLWPGVFFGSVLLNIWVSIEHVSLTSAGLGVAVGAAMGATLQALLGAWLVRRFIGFPTALGKERDIILFMLIAGPAACLINASFGVTSLLATGLITGSDYAYSWFTWWVGDAVGVMIAAPLMFIAFAQPRQLWWSRRISIAAPLIVMSSAVIILFVWASKWELDRTQFDFKEAASDTADKLQVSFDNYLDAVTSIERFFVSSSNITREDFRLFVKHLISKPGIQGLSWNPVILKDQRDDFEKSIREEGFTGFQITERDSEGKLIRAASRDEYVVVSYIEPMKGNEPALGFDVASNIDRLKAINQARDNGQAVATERITLVQERGDQAGFLLFYPVYKGLHSTVQERRRNLRGFAVGVFRIGDIVDAVLRGQHHTKFIVGIYDESTSAKTHLYGPEDRNLFSIALFEWSMPLEIGGRHWTMSIMPSANYLASNRGWQAWAILTAGFTFVGMLCVFLLAMTGRSYQVEKLVDERTIALEYSNKELESYSYSIAHDLRAPLRSIVGFSQIVLEDASDKLDSEDLWHLQRIIKSAKHMAELIDDILELSRVSRSDMRISKVNLSNICLEISKALCETDPDRLVEWRIQDNLVVKGDERLLHLVLRNLLGNAWKFTQKNSQTIIEFGLMDEAGQKVYYVRDNGIGFDMEYADKIFGLFQRLHRAEEYEGTGVGLATVQRIINRHGGWLRAEGEKGRGTTIYFSIPEAEAEAEAEAA